MCTTLSDYRKATGYTQETLATALGVDRSTVAKWEIGECYPRTPMLIKLAKLLSITEGEVIASITVSRKTG